MKNDVGRFNLLAAAAIAISLGGVLWMRPNVTYSFAITTPDHSNAHETLDPGSPEDGDTCDEDESGYPEHPDADSEDTCLGDPMDPQDAFPI